MTTDNDRSALLKTLRTHFNTGATLPYVARRDALKRLRVSLGKYEEEILGAMHADMRKPRFEAYLSDVGLVYTEIDHALAHLKEWMRPAHPPTPLSLQVSSSTVRPEPLGVVLIIAPWNYPALLVLSPLVGAIAAGNCVVVKPSNETPHTAAVLERIIGEAFAPEHVLVVKGPGGMQEHTHTDRMGRVREDGAARSCSDFADT
ncbi:MAG: aldehyde dehydrogenase family protein, partial [Flavobacteriales bacterium]